MWTCEQCGTAANVAPEDFPLICSCGTRHEVRPSRGLGDTIAKMTKAAGIRPCGGCGKRRGKLNAIFPYRDGSDPG